MLFAGVRVTHSDGFVDGKGSGIMLFASNTDKLIHVYDSLAIRGGPRLYGEVIHEMSHYFFGAGHVGNSDVSLSATRYTSFLSGYSVHNGNAFGNFLGYEKLRMGWLDEKKNCSERATCWTTASLKGSSTSGS